MRCPAKVRHALLLNEPFGRSIWSGGVPLTGRTGGKMQSEGWFSPATIVGMWSAVAATVGSVIAWRVFSWQREVDRPVVTCDLTSCVEDPDWLLLSIGVKNITDTRWVLKELQFRPKTAARGATRATANDKGGGRRFDSATASANAVSPVPLSLSVASAGTPGFRSVIGGDTVWQRVYLPRSSIRSSRLSMRLILLSKDPVQRRIVIAIRREVPAAPNTAID